MKSIREHYFDAMVAQEVVARENCVREMLGRWVSELEPCLVLSQDGEIVGLAAAGDHFILKVSVRPKKV